MVARCVGRGGLCHRAVRSRQRILGEGGQDGVHGLGGVALRRLGRQLLGPREEAERGALGGVRAAHIPYVHGYVAVALDVDGLVLHGAEAHQQGRRQHVGGYVPASALSLGAQLRQGDAIGGEQRPAEHEATGEKQAVTTGHGGGGAEGEQIRRHDGLPLEGNDEEVGGAPQQAKAREDGQRCAGALSCQKHDGAAQTQDEQVVYDVALWDGEDAVVPRQLEEQEA